MAHNDMIRQPPLPGEAADRERAEPAVLFEDGLRQGEVIRELATYLAIFLAIAFITSLVVKLLGAG
jgi:hypothetical protein